MLVKEYPLKIGQKGQYFLTPKTRRFVELGIYPTIETSRSPKIRKQEITNNEKTRLAYNLLLTYIFRHLDLQLLKMKTKKNYIR